MSKDAFSDIPVIDSEPEYVADHTSPQSPPENITKGTASKNIFRTLSKIGIPLAGISVLVWLFIPTQRVHKVKEEAPVNIDQVKQVSDTNTLIEKLKSDAKAQELKTEPIVKAHPDVAGTTTPSVKQTSSTTPIVTDRPGTQSQPQQYNENALSDLKKLQERDEAIRASPLDANGKFNLVASKDNPVGTKSTPLSDLEEELMRTTARKSDSVKLLEDAQKDMIAKLGKSAPPTQRNPNEAFLDSQGTKAQGTLVKQQDPATSIIINQGTVIRTVLLSGISSDLPGTVTAQVTSDVYDSIYKRYLLIPKGSKLIGSYSSDVNVGQSVVMLAMTRLILPNGTWVPLLGTPGTNMIGQSGIPADVNNHYWKMFSASFVIGATSLMMKGSDNTITNQSGMGISQSTGSVAAMAMNDAVTNLMQRNKNIPPTLTVGPGQEFMFLVAADIGMQPYRPAY